MDEHAARVRGAYVALRGDFEDWTPSAAFRETFRLSVIAELRRRLTRQPVIRILEVGCGHGTWAEEIYRSMEEADRRVRYLGIDFAEPRIELGRQRLAAYPGAELRVADAETFEPDAPFDIILGIEVISHIRRRDQLAWLQRWFGWLAPAGTAIIIDKDRFSWHAVRLDWDWIRRRWLRWWPSSGPYYFPERYDTLTSTLYYPSFAALQRGARRLRYGVRPLIRHGIFRALQIDKLAE